MLRSYRRKIRQEKPVAEPKPISIPIDQPEELPLKGDQIKAFRTITELIQRGQPIVKLCGFAGTGKTFLLAQIAKWARRIGFETTIAAPTHKAAGVIQEKLKTDIDVRTIHSLLGLRLEPDYENDTGGHILTAGDGKPKVANGLVICDEASMVGKDLKERIDAMPFVQWLFVGDLAQLPPVGESVSQLLDSPDATLETVLRQANGSEILTLATDIRQGDMSLSFEDGKDVHQVADAQELFDEARKRFASPEYQADGAHARMLVFRNDRRKAINSRMRQLIVNREEPYTPGEWLVMYAQFAPEKSKLNLMAEAAKSSAYNSRRKWAEFFAYKRSLGDTVTQLHVSEEVRIEEATPGKVCFGDDLQFDVWKLVVAARGSTFELPVPTEAEWKRLQEIKTDLIGQAHEMRQTRDDLPVGSKDREEAEKERRELWSAYYTLDETFAQVDYAFAMTVHKSQGSTFDHAFVDVPDLMSSGGMQQRILYTAVTRPAKSLTFYV